MAVTMSSATINDDARQTLLGKTVDGGITSGGATLNTQSTGLFGLGGDEATGAALAGVTSSFATNVSRAIESYVENINSIIAKLSTVETNVAFKGAGVEAALNNFINGVKAVSVVYTNALKAAEVQIINSVSLAYSTQDTDLSGNINADQSTLVDSNNFTTV